MIKDDIKLAFRQMTRNKLLTSINLVCLSVATAVCCTIFVLYRYETGFDKYRDSANRIFRIYSSYSGTIVSQSKNVPTAYGQFVKDNFASVEESTLFITWVARTSLDQRNGQRKNLSKNDRIAFVDPSYFKLFSDYQWLKGTPEKSLLEPNQVVLTESRAHYYFGNAELSEIMGREIIYQDSLVLNVSGVVKDIDFTDLDFTDFVSKRTIESSWMRSSMSMDDWYSSSGHLFFKKRNAATDEDIQKDIELLKKRSDRFTRNLGFFNSPQVESLPLMHFNNIVGVFDHTRPIIQKSTLDVCVVLALILLLMACINMVNIESARVSEHAKVVGIKKVLGTSRILIVRQFLLATAIIAIISVSVGLAAVYPIVHFFPSFFPKSLALNISDPILFVFISTLCIVITMIAGIYPALRSTSGTTIDTFRTSSLSNNTRSGSGVLRKALIFFQYSNSQIFIVIAFVVVSQVSFIFQKDLGFESNNIIYFSTPYNSTQSQRNVLLQKIMSDSRVQSACTESDLPMGLTFTTATLEGFNGKERIAATVDLKNVDSAYFKTFDVKILAGRGLKSSDSVSEYVINDAYRRLMGFQTPSAALGYVLNGMPIVGVVADFNTHSLHEGIGPLAISNNGRENFLVSVRLNDLTNTQDLNSTIVGINQAWSSVFADEMPDIKFMDQTIQSFYVDDIQASKLAKIISVLAIIISSLGLFGLSMFTVSKRSKEAGIRRIFGASQSRIMLLFSEDILRLIVISFILSTPISIYFATEWLERFKYRIEIGPGLFILAGVVSLTISLATIGFVIFKAAKTPIIDTIRE